MITLGAEGAYFVMSQSGDITYHLPSSWEPLHRNLGDKYIEYLLRAGKAIVCS